MSTVEAVEPRTTTRPVRAGRPVTAAVGGAFIVACAVAAGSAVVLPDWRVATYAPRPGWQYTPALWPLLVALLAAGVLIMTRPRLARPAAVVAAIVAVQIAGNGWVAIREWFSIFGLGGLAKHHLVALHTYAVAVPLAATAAAVVAAALVWREPAAGWRGTLPSQPGYVVAGAAVVVLVPLMWDVARVSLDIIGFRHVASLTYTLPWGVGLATAGWLPRRAARAAVLTVAVSAAACLAYIAATYLHGYLFPPPPGD